VRFTNALRTPAKNSAFGYIRHNTPKIRIPLGLIHSKRARE